MLRRFLNIKANRTMSQFLKKHVRFKQCYCISDVFVIFVGYFKSYLLLVNFQIRTHTNIFMFTLFWYILSIIVVMSRFFKAIIYCFTIILKHQGKHNGENLVSICYLLFKEFWWIIFAFVMCVGYILSYLWQDFFHIKTHTHNFIFTFFWSILSIIVFFMIFQSHNILCCNDY